MKYPAVYIAFNYQQGTMLQAIQEGRWVFS